LPTWATCGWRSRGSGSGYPSSACRWSTAPGTFPGWATRPAG
jgi:hypothetical protein